MSKRTFNWVNPDFLKEYADEQELSHAELSKQLQQSATMVGQWIRDNRAPGWTVLAVDGLKARAGWNWQAALATQKIPDYKSMTDKDLANETGRHIQEVNFITREAVSRGYNVDIRTDPLIQTFGQKYAHERLDVEILKPLGR